MALRDLVKDVHTDAEKSPWANLLMSGNITKPQYAGYLYQQEMIYRALEIRAGTLGILDEIPGIARRSKIASDFLNLNVIGPMVPTPSTLEYCTYVKDISQQQCWAHIYVRHFGDMYGGSMIAKVIPGDGEMYQFEEKGKLIKYVREKLSDDMQDEARLVFKYATRLFKELEDVYNI